MEYLFHRILHQVQQCPLERDTSCFHARHPEIDHNCMEILETEMTRFY